MRWEAHDQNDRTLIVAVPEALLHKVAQESELDPKRMEILNRFQIRDRELEYSAGRCSVKRSRVFRPAAFIWMD